MGQCSGWFSVQSCQGRSEWPCRHGCLPLHPSSPGCRWVLGSRCGAGPGHRCCLPCHGWAVCCQGALVWLKLPAAPVEGAPRPFGQKPAREAAASERGAPRARAADGDAAQGQGTSAAPWARGQTKPAARHSPELLVPGISPGPSEQRIPLRRRLHADKQRTPTRARQACQLLQGTGMDTRTLVSEATTRTGCSRPAWPFGERKDPLELFCRCSQSSAL